MQNTLRARRDLHLVEEVIQREGLLAQTLALAGVCNYLEDLAALLKWVALHLLPMVEHTLGESLASRVGAEISSEAE